MLLFFFQHDYFSVDLLIDDGHLYLVLSFSNSGHDSCHEITADILARAKLCNE